MNNKIKYYLIVILLICFSCANPQPPSGGPPDKTPPKIISSYPEQNALNFIDDHITLEFSEWVSRNTVIENLYISPSIEYEYDWSGTELEIEFKENLDSNTTYVLSLGTDWSDLKSNKPESAFTLIFSTGTYVDSCSIKGKLYGKDIVGAFVYAYKIDDLNPDTLNPTHTKPHYKTQIGTSGEFELLALKPGLYRLFSIKDTYKDVIYNEGADEFGAAPEDIYVAGDSIPIVNLKLGPQIDKTGPMLYNADCLFNNFITLNFSEPLDTNSIQKDYIKLTDSAETKSIQILALSINNSSSDKINLIPESPLDTNTLWKIQITTSNYGTITDTASNPIQDSANYTYFYSVTEFDTTKIKIPKLPFKDSTNSISLNPEIRFVFDRPLKINNLDKTIEFQSSNSIKVEVNIKIIAGKILAISPQKPLFPNSWYTLKLNLSKICYYNNSCLPDSSLLFHFKTLDDKIFGGAKGKIKNFTLQDTNLIVVFSDGKNKFQTTVNDTGYWELKQLPKGKYNVEVFKDINLNSKYDYGNAYPFKHSEPFIVSNTQQFIKPRWTIEIILPKPN